MEKLDFAQHDIISHIGTTQKKEGKTSAAFQSSPAWCLVAFPFRTHSKEACNPHLDWSQRFTVPSYLQVYLMTLIWATFLLPRPMW